MQGFIGCDNRDLQPGTRITTGHHLELTVTIIRLATIEEARESAAAMGHPPLDVMPGEQFYLVDIVPVISR